MSSVAPLAAENERLQRALRARLSEEAALRRVATLVARQHAPDEVFTLVTQEVARHLNADAAITVRYDAPGLATVVATAHPHRGTGVEVGKQIVLVPEMSLARVQATVAPARADSLKGIPGDYAAVLRPTRPAAASSATSTTAPSSTSSASRCRCGSWPGGRSRPPPRRSRPASRI